MKGIFIYKQIEFRLEVAGDEFFQGDSLVCTFIVKNHSNQGQDLGKLRLDLAKANLSKLKQKSPDALDILESLDCDFLGTIDAQQQKNFSYKIQLENNCLITDRSHSLCLIYGLSEEPEATGNVLVLLKPHRHIRQILDILQGNYQFVLKSEKFSDSFVQAKLKPPSARKYSFLDELLLNIQFSPDALILKYIFKVKKIQATAASVAIKRGKAELEQHLDPKSYLLTAEHINPDLITAKIDEALATVSTGL